MAVRTYKLTSPAMRGPEVKTIQRRLAGANKFKENYKPGTIDGVFGEGTAAACYRAKCKLGVTESPIGSNRQEFGVWYGFNGVPWCAIFMTWCFDPIGSKAFVRGSRFSYVGAITAAARAGGRGLAVVKDPRPGDLVCWGDYHVGI